MHEFHSWSTYEVVVGQEMISLFKQRDRMHPQSHLLLLPAVQSWRGRNQSSQPGQLAFAILVLMSFLVGLHSKRPRSAAQHHSQQGPPAATAARLLPFQIHFYAWHLCSVMLLSEQTPPGHEWHIAEKVAQT